MHYGIKQKLNSMIDRLAAIKDELKPYGIKLIAVSKTRSVSAIQEMYDLRQRDFGENRVEELVEKAGQLPKDIRWHMIGHLQSRKVKAIIPFIHLIHSVDSIKLLEKIDREAALVHRKISVLLQFHIAKEETKYGFESRDIPSILEIISACNNILITGVMGMATFTDNAAQIRAEFKSLVAIYHQLKQSSLLAHITEVSMGMSGDYMIAAQEGSTMVRIGSLLFEQ